MVNRKTMRTWPYFVLAVVGLAAAGIFGAFRGDVVHTTLAEAGLLLTLLGWAVCKQLAASSEETAQRIAEMSTLVSERFEQFSVMINLISEQQLISERAKMVAFREKDHDTLLRAIRDELNRGEYDAALLLVNDMESTFGYRQEAVALRGEISQLRDATIRRSVAEVMTQIDRDCSAENWDDAIAKAQKTATIFPGHEMTVGLVGQVMRRKDSIKQQLLARWRDAVARKDIDGSIDVLRSLDLYVSPDEVAQLKDGALEIFKARIERLREQFKSCVHEKKWTEALLIGEDIVQEFPTSKLAQEVRDMMDTLKTRAAEETVPAM